MHDGQNVHCAVTTPARPLSSKDGVFRHTSSSAAQRPCTTPMTTWRRAELDAGVIDDPERDGLFRGHGRRPDAERRDGRKPCGGGRPGLHLPDELLLQGQTAWPGRRRPGGRRLRNLDQSVGSCGGHGAVAGAGGGLVCRNHDGTPATPVWKAARYIAYGRGFAPTRSSLHGIVTPPIQSGE